MPGLAISDTAAVAQGHYEMAQAPLSSLSAGLIARFADVTVGRMYLSRTIPLLGHGGVLALRDQPRKLACLGDGGVPVLVVDDTNMSLDASPSPAWALKATHTRLAG